MAGQTISDSIVQVWPLLASAGAMGLSGSLHCLVMCATLHHVASTPAPIARRAPHDLPAPTRTWPLHVGRVFGYALLGTAIGASSGLLWRATSMHPAMRTVWIMLQAALLVYGLATVALGRQPAVVGAWWFRRLPGNWPAPRRQAASAAGRPAAVSDEVPVNFVGRGVQRPGVATLWVRGMAWALLPCGLLYSAVGLALMAASPWGSGAVMATFGLGTWVGLALATTLIRRLKPVLAGWLIRRGPTDEKPDGTTPDVPGRQNRLVGDIAVASARGDTGDGAMDASVRAARQLDTIAIRLAGATVAALSGIALHALAMGQSHPFCAS